MKYPNLKEEKKLWRRGYRFIAGVDEAGRGCEKSDAEVLTNNGWKYYFDINPIKDKVLSYTNDGYLRWQKIDKIIEKNFEGNLIELKNRGIDIIVTPDHYFTILRRVFKRDKKDNNRLELVGYTTRKERRVVTDLSVNDFIPRGGKWEGRNKEFFKLPKIGRNKEKLIDIKLWVAFLGLFLAEGSTSYYKKKGMYRIAISQSKNKSPDKYRKIYLLLRKLPFRFNQSKISFTCCNKQLYTYLKRFGKRYDKFIPEDIKELPSHLLAILINWMIFGDGACYKGKNRKKVCIYYTVSKKLKDDFEEVLLKAGWTYHTNVREPREARIRGRIIKKENQVPCFEIRLRRNNKAIVKHLHKKKVFYKGKVFCLQLSNHHNFYVRRNGTGYFTGNSLAGPVVAAAVSINSRKFVSKFAKIRDVKDSKKLTPKKREEIYKTMMGCQEIKWGIGRVSEKVIDRINIKNAAELAMERAVKNLENKINKKKNNKRKNPAAQRRVDFLLIDGKYLKNKKLKTMNHKLIVRADEKVLSCSMASIIAKVKRDRIMIKEHKNYPQYGFDKHKGYGVKYHIRILKKNGLSKIHRKSFKVKRLRD